jgi:DNA-binding response OmpR family regulator
VESNVWCHGGPAAAESFALNPILILEDEPGLQRLLTRALTNAGFDVLSAESAEEAVAAGEGRTLALLVADVNARGASGPAVAEVLRERQPDLRVLFISGHDPVFLESHGIPPTADFLQKPFSPRTFVEVVQRMLGVNPPA